MKAAVFVGALLVAGGTTASLASHLRQGQAVELTSKKPPFDLVVRRPGVLHLPVGVAQNGRFVRTVVVDHGEVVISPPPARATATVPLETAEQTAVDSLSAYGGTYYRPSAPDLGVVTITARGNPRRQFDRTLAWVAISSPGLPGTCITSPPSPPGATYRFPIVLVGARTGGDLAIYLSRGIAPCQGPISGPSFLKPREGISLSATVIGQQRDATESGHVDWIIRYRIPTCGDLLGPGLAGGTFQHPRILVAAYFPFPRPAACAAETKLLTFGPESVPWSRVTTVPSGRLLYQPGR